MKLTEAEWITLADFRTNWSSFCDCDAFEDADTFAERMEAAGFIELHAVTSEDLESSFAVERGIEPDGMVWRITPAGRAALEASR